MVGTISSLIGVGPYSCIAVVGAGGKTALCWQLIQETRQRHQRVLFTTTTKIWEPAPSAFDVCLTHNSMPDTLQALAKPHWQTACLMGSATDMHSTQRIADSYMPVITTKRNGIDPDELCAIHATLADSLVIIEADGARNLPLKAPGEMEPVIPRCTDIVCVMASLNAIGQPLNDHTVHRPAQYSRLTGLELNAPITLDAVLNLLTHPAGGLKGIPNHARTIAVLTQRTASQPDPATQHLLERLVQRGYDSAWIWHRPPH